MWIHQTMCQTLDSISGFSCIIAAHIVQHPEAGFFVFGDISALFQIKRIHKGDLASSHVPKASDYALHAMAGRETNGFPPTLDGNGLGADP
jgi:hypothetical protein